MPAAVRRPTRSVEATLPHGVPWAGLVFDAARAWQDNQNLMPVLTRSERQRLLQAVVFFASHTQHCGKIKLFKLLYLLDFEHFRQTGKSATGLDYQAWKFGPVPIELMQEWEDLGPDLARLVQIVEEKVIDYERQAVQVKDGVQFDAEPFSPRQLRIMRALAEQYRNTYSPKMIDVTHAQNGAWDRVWQDGQGAFRAIPYELAIGEADPHAVVVRELAQQQAQYRAALLAARHAEPA
jgi:uncharacterized phage-associated protein